MSHLESWFVKAVMKSKSFILLRNESKEFVYFFASKTPISCSLLSSMFVIRKRRNGNDWDLTSQIGIRCSFLEMETNKIAIYGRLLMLFKFVFAKSSHRQGVEILRSEFQFWPNNCQNNSFNFFDRKSIAKITCNLSSQEGWEKIQMKR